MEVSEGAAALSTRRVGTGQRASRRALAKPAPERPEAAVAKARGVGSRPRPPQSAAFSKKPAAAAPEPEPEPTLGRRERPPPVGIRYLDLGNVGGDGAGAATATLFLLGYTLYLIGGRGLFGEVARQNVPQESAFETATPGVAYSQQKKQQIAAKTGQPVGSVDTAPPLSAADGGAGTNRQSRKTGQAVPRLTKAQRSRAVLQTQRKVNGQKITRVAASKANNRRVKSSALIGQRRAQKKRLEAQRRARKRARKQKARQTLARSKAELSRKTKLANARRARGL